MTSSVSRPPISPPRAPRAQIVGAFALVDTVWGSTYLTIHIAIETLPALLMSGARFILAGLMLYAFARRRGAPKERLTFVHWRSALIIGGGLLPRGHGGGARGGPG